MSAPDWRLFHPEEIVFYSEGENNRDGIIMVNWDYRLGRSLEWPGALPDVWQEMKEAWRNEEAPPRAETRDLRDFTE